MSFFAEYAITLIFHMYKIHICTPCSFRLADAYYANESVKLLADENKIKYKVV